VLDVEDAGGLAVQLGDRGIGQSKLRARGQHLVRGGGGLLDDGNSRRRRWLMSHGGEQEVLRLSHLARKSIDRVLLLLPNQSSLAGTRLGSRSLCLGGEEGYSEGCSSRWCADEMPQLRVEDGGGERRDGGRHPQAAPRAA
jgi:hypothetical protein